MRRSAPERGAGNRATGHDRRAVTRLPVEPLRFVRPHVEPLPVDLRTDFTVEGVDVEVGGVGAHPVADAIRADDRIVTATGEGALPFIDADDIARVAVEVLARPEPTNAALLLTGPQALSYGEVAAILTSATGRSRTTVSRVAAAGSPPGKAAIAHPPPRIHGRSGWAAAYAVTRAR